MIISVFVQLLKCDRQNIVLSSFQGQLLQSMYLNMQINLF